MKYGNKQKSERRNKENKQMKTNRRKAIRKDKYE